MAAAAAEAVPRFCVLGGGLSGLASAFFLQRSFPHARVQVVEQSKRCGGQIRSLRGVDGEAGVAFERGFQSSILVNKNGREALGLVKLLGLGDDAVSANIEASSRRHLFHHGRLQLFPRVPHILGYGPALLAEPLWFRGPGADESVHAFVRRRTSAAVADRLADPICLGQFGGDARQLSVRTCFPRLWFNERRFRSVFVGSLFSTVSAYRRRSWLSLDLIDPLLQRISNGGRSYSFEGGLESLTERLVERLQAPPLGTRPCEILTGAEIASLQPSSLPSPSAPSPAAEVVLGDGRRLAADTVIATLPPHELARLLGSSGLDVAAAGAGAGDQHEASLCQLLESVAQEVVAVVNVSFDSDVFRTKRLRGAGYFCGSLEQQPVLGMTWDSQLFPPSPTGSKKNTMGGVVSSSSSSSKSSQAVVNRTRLTVYFGGRQCDGKSEGEIEGIALKMVRQHLGIEEEPKEATTTLWPQALPQYAVGHRGKMRAVDGARLQHLPWLQVAGPGFFGTRSVADEVVDARKLTDALSRRFAHFPVLVENETEEDVAERYGGGFDTE